MSTSDYITLAVALTGAITGIVGTGLGAWSLFRQIDQDRVKLRIGVSQAIPVPSFDSPFLCVSVTNLSKFPVTINEVGLLIKGDQRRAICLEAQTNDGRRLPIRMEPRTSVSVYFPPEFSIDPELDSARCAYANTDCGEQVESDSGGLSNLIADIRRRYKG